ncbi:MAG: sulfite exporter TauE/SafE family protein [Anaerolineales bacterium]|nr:sulfite exporter TauE/SafE family protein [Anaerolineales bacterium]
MEYLVICLVAVLVSALTLFSGFGLGTLLMPAFALFFPLPVAIAATAVVHLANNIFKVILVGKQADWGVVLRFAIPGAVAAMIGAALLNLFSDTAPLAAYSLNGQAYEITLIKLVIGMVIIAFAFFELLPYFNKLAFERKYLPWGGLLSGFFGGLSGNQGALRSAFLIKAGLDKGAFVGTGTVSSVIVDVARLLVYGVSFYSVHFAGVSDIWRLVLAATLAAFLGAFIGSRLVKKITLRALQVLVGAMLMLVGLGMASGLL